MKPPKPAPEGSAVIGEAFAATLALVPPTGELRDMYYHEVVFRFKDDTMTVQVAVLDGWFVTLPQREVDKFGSIVKVMHSPVMPTLEMSTIEGVHADIEQAVKSLGPDEAIRSIGRRLLTDNPAIFQWLAKIDMESVVPQEYKIAHMRQVYMATAVQYLAAERQLRLKAIADMQAKPPHDGLTMATYALMEVMGHLQLESSLIDGEAGQKAENDREAISSLKHLVTKVSDLVNDLRILRKGKQ